MPPESSAISAVRLDHSISSKGEMPAVAKVALKVSPLADVEVDEGVVSASPV